MLCLTSVFLLKKVKKSQSPIHVTLSVCLSVSSVCVFGLMGGGVSAGRLGGGKHVTSVRGEHCQDLESKKKKPSAHFLQHGSERTWR